MDKKIAIFGCKNTTKFMISSLLEKIDIDYLITIDSEMGEKFSVADYADLSKICIDNNIKKYTAKTYSLKNKDDQKYIQNIQIDLAFVIGWQRIIPKSILDSLSIGAFGMHGSSMDLPLGRGRSPLNWSIIEGRNCFYTNLFKYDPGIDSGDILDVNKFSISSNDTSETMHFKNTLSMKYLIEKNLNSLLNNNFTLRKQNDITPTYYPKREPGDSLINWESDIDQLDRFIRAVTKPFNGAYTFIDKKKIIIYDANIFDIEQDYGYANKKNGEIVAVFPNRKFLVKCNGGLLLVNEYEGEDLIIKPGRIFKNYKQKIRKFKKNKEGYYDL